jgi:hypothetical protein
MPVARLPGPALLRLARAFSDFTQNKTDSMTFKRAGLSFRQARPPMAPGMLRSRRAAPQTGALTFAAALS